MPTGLGPIPMRATIHLAGNQLRCDFDLPLTVGPLDAANWWWRYGDAAFVAETATAAGVRVTVNGTAEVEDPGPNVCSYRPPPFDVLGFCKGKAKAFELFPIG